MVQEQNYDSGADSPPTSPPLYSIQITELPHSGLHSQHGMHFRNVGWIWKKTTSTHQFSSEQRISGLSHPAYPLPSPLLMGSDHHGQLHLSENVFISGKSNPLKILLAQSSQTTDIMVSEPGQRLGFSNQAFELCDGRE
jgi:hypothetical protein